MKGAVRILTKKPPLYAASRSIYRSAKRDKNFST